MRTRLCNLLALPSLLIFAACASTAGDGPKTRTVRGPTSCPPGWVLICESRKPLPDLEEGEIPEYEYCRCRNAMN